MSEVPIAAVVLAGGLGTRIQHLLPDLPKPMAPAAGRPWLEWVARYLARQNVPHIVISAGYRAELIQRHFEAQPVAGARVRTVVETTPLGTAGAVIHAVAASGWSAPIWAVLNGDTLAFADLSLATAALREPALAGVIFGRRVADAARYGGLVADAGGRLIRYEEKRAGQGMVSAGVSLLRAEWLAKFPVRRPLSLEQDVFPALLSQGAFFKVLPMNVPFLDIGTPESLPQAGPFVEANREQFASDAV